MIIRKTAVILSLLMFSACKVFPQWSIMNAEADSLVIQGSKYIYNIEFANAEMCFRQVQNKFPDHPAGYFLDAMIDWWKILIDKPNTSKYRDNFLKKIEKTISKCDYLIAEDPININALFFKAGALGYRARFYVEDESWLNAVSDGNEAFELLKRCLKLAPSNHDIMLGTGIYNYFAAAIPEKYPIVKPMLLMLPQGDKRLGELQLKSAAKNARYCSVEAQVALMQIFYSFESRPADCMAILDDLTKNYPNNPYFKKYYARNLVRMGAWMRFEEVWREMLINCIDKKFGYENTIAREAMYYIGMALQRKGDYEQALKYYYKSDEGSRVLDKNGTSGFMVMTNLNIGKIYDKQGKRELARKQYQKVLNMKDANGAHNEAKKYLKEAFK